MDQASCDALFDSSETSAAGAAMTVIGLRDRRERVDVLAGRARRQAGPGKE